MRYLLFSTLLLLGFSMHGQTTSCQADFFHAADSCEIFFDDMSSPTTGGQIVSWSWDFGDGSHANTSTPIHVYTSPGTYIVKLKIIDDLGCIDSTEKPVIAPSCGQPLDCFADFNHYGDSCTISFTDLSGSSSGVAITSWNWDFGDGNTSSAPNPVHTYTAAGTYNVGLSITDAAGCQNYIQKPVVANHCGPQPNCFADFTHQGDSCTIFFVDQSSSSTGVPVSSWYWDFGDGNTSTVQNPVHTYPAAGMYYVNLNITDASGCQNFVQKTVFANHCGPQGSCIADFTHIIDSCTVQFTDQSLPTAGGSIVNWNWDFGDGTFGNGPNPVHTYFASGTYLVKLMITDDLNCTHYIDRAIAIQNCGPPPNCIADFTHQGDSCTIFFADQSSSSTGVPIVSWNWDFGDGNFSTVPNPVHTYAAAGMYYVHLDITDASGCTNSVQKPVFANHCGPQLDCFADFNHTGDSCTISFMDQSFSSSGVAIVNWNWDFGDGNISNIPNPVHTYTAAGTYTVQLDIIDANGCHNYVQKPVVAHHCGPQGACFADFTHFEDSCTVQFTDQSTPTSGGNDCQLELGLWGRNIWHRPNANPYLSGSRYLSGKTADHR